MSLGNHFRRYDVTSARPGRYARHRGGATSGWWASAAMTVSRPSGHTLMGRARCRPRGPLHHGDESSPGSLVCGWCSIAGFVDVRRRVAHGPLIGRSTTCTVTKGSVTSSSGSSNRFDWSLAMYSHGSVTLSRRGPAGTSQRRGPTVRDTEACEYWARIGHGSVVINFSGARFEAQSHA